MAFHLRAGKPRAFYRLTQKWTHPPILWAAIDEVVRGGHGGHGAYGAQGFSVGGGASGHW